MKRLLIAALLVAGPAMSTSEYMKGDDLQAEVKRICESGCIVFSPAEVKALTDAVAQLIAEKEQEAFMRGRKYEHASCRNLL